MLVRVGSNGKFLPLLVGMQNGTATLEDILAVFVCLFAYKATHSLTISSRNCTAHKNVHMNV